MLMPPRNAVRPSTISSLRWSRWFNSHSLRATAGLMGLNSSTWMPLSVNCWKKARRGTEGAYAVTDEIDLHTLLLFGDQCLCKALADLVVVQDVGLHVDVILRRQNGRVHCLVGGGAILQQPHLVAGGQRAADDGLFQRQMAGEDVGVLASARQAIEDRLALCG